MYVHEASLQERSKCARVHIRGCQSDTSTAHISQDTLWSKIPQQHHSLQLNTTTSTEVLVAHMGPLPCTIARLHAARAAPVGWMVSRQAHLHLALEPQSPQG